MWSLIPPIKLFGINLKVEKKSACNWFQMTASTACLKKSQLARTRRGKTKESKIAYQEYQDRMEKSG